MIQAAVKMLIPFESLVEVITSLEIEDKTKLNKILEEDIAEVKPQIALEQLLQQPVSEMHFEQTLHVYDYHSISFLFLR